MRQARIRPRDTDTFMHVCNRVCGALGEYPFGAAEKQYFIKLMRDLTRIYTVGVVAYQLMGNHFHILLHVPGACLRQDEAVARFNRYHDGKRVIEPNSPEAERLPAKLRDVSAFMHALEQGFSRWFNRTRTPRRRGYLWANRFRSTILQSGLSVWHCWQYIFVKTVVAQARGGLAVNKRRLTRAFSPDEDAKAAAPPALYAFKQLRRLV